MARPTIFPNVSYRVHGFITKPGSAKFEAARRRLAELVGWKVKAVSDGNVIEFLLRGEAEAVKYLRTAGLLK